MPNTTDFINNETGEVLATIDYFFNLVNLRIFNLAKQIASELVRDPNSENFNQPIIVISTNGNGVQLSAIFDSPFNFVKNEEEEEN